MKKMKLFAGTLLIMLCLNSLGQDTIVKAKELIYIRIQEKVLKLKGIESYMNITYPDATTRLVELTTLGEKGQGAEENGKKILWELNILINQGYEIKSTSSSGDINYSTTTMVLVRIKPD